MTTYLLRLNLDIKEKNFKDQLRFKLAASSVKSLSKRTNKVVILSHLGRPQPQNDAERYAERRGRSQHQSALSLRKFAKGLNQATGKKIKFIPHFNFKKIKGEITRAPGGSVLLLENLRFLPGETKNSKTLAKQLASLGNRYINNDFANSHRAHASMSAIAKFLPGTAGPLLKKEIQALTKIKKNPRRPFVLIIGGAKMSDKILFMKYLLPKVDYILVGGGPANNFLKIRGVDIGSSINEPKLAQTTKLLSRSKKVVIPADWRREKDKILDIGPETIKLYSQIISQARTIIWNGPMGFFEDKRFAAGTEKIARAILKNKKARIVIGGAETTAALFRASPRRIAPAPLDTKLSNGVNPRFWVSTGGGAMLEFLAGKKLPGIESLKRRR